MYSRTSHIRPSWENGTEPRSTQKSGIFRRAIKPLLTTLVLEEKHTFKTNLTINYVHSLNNNHVKGCHAVCRDRNPSPPAAACDDLRSKKVINVDRVVVSSATIKIRVCRPQNMAIGKLRAEKVFNTISCHFSSAIEIRAVARVAFRTISTYVPSQKMISQGDIPHTLSWSLKVLLRKQLVSKKRQCQASRGSFRDESPARRFCFGIDNSRRRYILMSQV